MSRRSHCTPGFPPPTAMAENTTVNNNMLAEDVHSSDGTGEEWDASPAGGRDNVSWVYLCRGDMFMVRGGVRYSGGTWHDRSRAEEQ